LASELAAIIMAIVELDLGWVVLEQEVQVQA